MPCSLVEIYRNFGGTCCLNRQCHSPPQRWKQYVYSKLCEFLLANTDIMLLKTVRSTGNEFFGSYAGLYEEVTYIVE